MLRTAAAIPLSTSALRAADALTRVPSFAPAPPLGWNSFDSYGVYLYEKAALQNLAAMIEKLKPAGYEYFVIDNGWFGEYKLVPGTMYAAEKHASDVRLNSFGLLQPSQTYFPNGLQLIAERAHNAGLKFGLHLMRGIPRKAVELNLPVQGANVRARDIANVNSTCSWCPYNYGVDMRKPGAQAFYDSLVGQLVNWGVDLIKADDIVPYPEEIIALATAIERSGKNIVLSLSPGGNAPLENLPYYRRANMLRITADVWDRRSDLDKGFEAWKKFSGSGRPGFWPDLDMIPFGALQLMSPKDLTAKGNAKLSGYGNTRRCQLTQDQQYTFITMRSLAASPLFAGGDLPSLDAFSLSLLTNPQMIACNQNGLMGANTYASDGIEIWKAADRKNDSACWIGIFNRNQGTRQVHLNAKNMGFPAGLKQRAYDIWHAREISFEQPDVAIPADGVLFLRVEISR